MPITLDDIRAERERRRADPAMERAQVEQKPPGDPLGITLADVQAEKARRATDFDPFNPRDSVPGPSGDRHVYPAREAIQEAFPTTLGSPDVVGPTAGEIAGGALGLLTGPAAPVASPLLGAAGAGAGLIASRWLRGEPVTTQEVTGEALSSLIPEAIVGVGKALVRASKAAKRARFSDLAQQLRHETGEVFQPPHKAFVTEAFDQVEQSGVKVDTHSMQQFVKQSGPQVEPLMREVRRIDNALKTGGEFEDVLTRLQAGQSGAYDIGRLQRLHSEIGKRLQTPNMPYEGKELLHELNGAIDDTIFNGLAKGQNAAKSDEVRAAIRVARAGWAKLRRTEELQSIVESSITHDASGAGVSVNLGKIKNVIRKGTGKAGKSIQRTFEHDPGARQQFYNFLDQLGDQHDKISVTMGDLPPQLVGQVITKLGDWMATIYESTAGRQAFADMVTSGHGTFTHSTIANLANVARRELDGMTEAARERRGSPPEPGSVIGNRSEAGSY